MKIWRIVLFVFLLVFFLPMKANALANVRIPVLLYHDFMTTLPASDPYNFQYINTPSSLDENIASLLADGYTFITFDQLYNAKYRGAVLPEKPIILTIDDGYLSNYTLVYPIIQKYNIKVSMYVVTNWMGQTIDNVQHFTWDQARTMQSSKLVTIYSHSQNHSFYNQVAVADFKADLIASIKTINQQLGYKSIQVYSYPYGAANSLMLRATTQSGVKFQLWDVGVNYLDSLDVRYIKRIEVPLGMTGQQIINTIENS